MNRSLSVFLTGMFIFVTASLTPFKAEADAPSEGHPSPLGSSRNCLSAHLQEGIELNTRRKTIYSSLSLGKSLQTSQIILFHERIAYRLLPLTRIERDAQVLQKQGIPFLCEEFESSPNLRQPELNLAQAPRIEDHKPFPTRKTKKKLKAALKDHDFWGLYQEAVSQIDYLAKPFGFHCMTRHTLESIARTAALASGDPRRQHLSARLLEVQILSLTAAEQIDASAVEVQTMGIPILCHDLPEINYRLL